MRLPPHRLLGRCWFYGWIVAGGLAVGAARMQAQDTLTLPADVSDDELAEVVVPLSDAVRRRISDALRQEQKSGGQPQSTGDPILDDVLNVIRRQGSVLEGSTLEAMLDVPNLSATDPVDPADPGQAPRLLTPLPRGIAADAGMPSAPFPASVASSASEMRFYVAESLLRSARELAALPGMDAQRRRLVAAMREQATVLMIDEFAPASMDH